MTQKYSFIGGLVRHSDNSLWGLTLLYALIGSYAVDGGTLLRRLNDGTCGTL